MQSKIFENYARLASDRRYENTLVAGRYAFHSQSEKLIVSDVARKLDLQPEDTFLEIGCGPGNLLLPLSQLVKRVAAVDSAPMLERVMERTEGKTVIDCYPGNFLEIDLPDEKFDKILIYSVLHYMRNAEEALLFIDRALSLLAPGGRMLLGDLPNRSKKERFLSSETGRRLSEEWAAKTANGEAHPLSQMDSDEQLIDIDDEVILKIMAHGRKAGFETFLLPQPPDLPFGYTREDILFVAHR